VLALSELVCKRDGHALFAPLSVRLGAGDCVELLGANGSGKTTLLRTLAGLYSQYDGSYECSDFIFQGHRMGLDELMTPLENLAWYGTLEGLALSEDELHDALVAVGMIKFALKPCQRLSQGQQRRVAMARWLLSRAQLWLLDEPYTSLDTSGQDLLNEVLGAHCAQGGAVLAATHVPLKVGKSRALQIDPKMNPQMNPSVGNG
jgi:heme exporter protein A